MKKKWLSRGVITIEASYIIPWSVLIIALLITMLFFVHNRAWYTAAACETALSGNRYVEGSAGTGSAGLLDKKGDQNIPGTHYAEETAAGRIRDQAMPGSEPEKQIACTYDATEVRFSGQDFPLFSEAFSWSVQESVKRVRPAWIIRSRWLLQGIIEGGTP
ncbi:MAG: hypothetical protein IJF82_03210 [Achromobacter sp.]|nr:hypothetical protein [Achromobacter sp.]